MLLAAAGALALLANEKMLAPAALSASARIFPVLFLEITYDEYF